LKLVVDCVWNKKSGWNGSRQASIYLDTMIDASSNCP
jgi:hypothetical protein